MQGARQQIPSLKSQIPMLGDHGADEWASISLSAEIFIHYPFHPSTWDLGFEIWNLALAQRPPKPAGYALGNFCPAVEHDE